MLVLSRKIDEKILLKVPGIKENIEISVVRIDKNKVRLGIDADSKVTILREEIANALTFSS